MGSVWSKIFGRRGCPHQTFFFSENYYEWSFMRYKKKVDRTFFRFVTIHAFDRQTDRQTDGFLLDIPCVALLQSHNAPKILNSVGAPPRLIE